MRLATLILIAAALAVGSASAQSPAQMTDSQIRQQMIRESISGYSADSAFEDVAK